MSVKVGEARRIERVRDATMDVIERRVGVLASPLSDKEVRAILDACLTARGFVDLVADVQLMLDEHYPADLFGPDPIDSGARFICKLREALTCIHAEPSS